MGLSFLGCALRRKRPGKGSRHARAICGPGFSRGCPLLSPERAGYVPRKAHHVSERRSSDGAEDGRERPEAGDAQPANEREPGAGRGGLCGHRADPEATAHHASAGAQEVRCDRPRAIEGVRQYGANAQARNAIRLGTRPAQLSHVLVRVSRARARRDLTVRCDREQPGSPLLVKAFEVTQDKHRTMLR